MADAALVDAREAVRQSCDSLVSRSTYFTTFNEGLGSSDYARWRRDLISFVTPAGQDFVAALVTAAVLPPVADYNDTLVAVDTAQSRVPLTMPQMRQAALLHVIRATLASNGESANLIRACKHAGGKVQVGGIDYDQALRLLDIRWQSASRPRR